MPSPPRLYPTDVSNVEWSILEPLIPAAKPGGLPPKWSRWTLCDGVFYIVRAGCHWRLVPREFPPWKTAKRPLAVPKRRPDERCREEDEGRKQSKKRTCPGDLTPRMGLGCSANISTPRRVTPERVALCSTIVAS
jgi:transposase